MRWDRGHESPDVIDRRGQGGGGRGPSPGLIYMLLRFAGRFGWKGILLALLAVGAVTFLQSQPQGGVPGPATPGDERARFVGFVLDDVQQTWAATLPDYQPAKVVLYTGSTPTACGYGVAAVGPFYCPLDERVYIDLSFYDELADRFGATGDFAEAYVIAHEIGHHVQQQLGTMDRVPEGQAAQGPTGASVRLELQADCYAGIWAASAAKRGLLDVGDFEEGLNAASVIGDDALQRQSSGTVRPDTFTHGTSAQRQQWLIRGYETGSLQACDTFGEPGLML